jgi:hypothetical protein
LCQLKEPLLSSSSMVLTGKIVSFDIFQFKKLHCALDTKIISTERFSVLLEIFFPSSLILSLWSGFSFLLGGILSF